MIIREHFGDKYIDFMKQQLKERKINDLYNINLLSSVDLDVCNYVIENLIPMNIKDINLGRRINRFEMVDISLNELEKFNNNISNDAEVVNSIIPIEEDETSDVFEMSTSISYELTYDGVSENSGSITKFVVPKDLYEISGYFFGHEQLHALKDVNYKEYVNQRRLGEVIPIFYEFLIYNPKEFIKKDVLKVRMSNIFNNSLDYKLFTDAYRGNKLNEIILGSDKESIIKSNVYEYNMAKVGSYLNSFYYALILYNMYKENPKKILDLVSRVLKHEMTTLEMLESLGIYGDIRGEIFEKELRNVKRLVK